MEFSFVSRASLIRRLNIARHLYMDRRIERANTSNRYLFPISYSLPPSLSDPSNSRSISLSRVQLLARMCIYPRYIRKHMVTWMLTAPCNYGFLKFSRGEESCTATFSMSNGRRAVLSARACSRRERLIGSQRLRDCFACFSPSHRSKTSREILHRSSKVPSSPVPFAPYRWDKAYRNFAVPMIFRCSSSDVPLRLTSLR